jgi:hypothetical protein
LLAERQQPVTAGDISRQREVKRQAVSSPFFYRGLEGLKEGFRGSFLSFETF